MRIGPEAAVHPKPRYWHKAALAALVVLIVAAGAWAIWHFYFRPPPIEPASVEKMAYPLPEKPSIAVLPFLNMSEDKKQEYFSDGLTEEIITALSKTPKMLVIARNSTFSYKGKAVKISQVAEELGVRYVLEGSVRKAEDRVRITAQLIDALTGHHLWAERYDREIKDIFAIQDEITMKIVTALRVELTEGEQARISAKGTDNLEAYLLRLQAGGQILRMNKDGMVLARQLAMKAIDLDPKYAQAYFSLASTYWFEVPLRMTKNARQSLARAMELTQKAISLDKSLAMTHGLLGMIYVVRRQHDEGISECEKAISLEPNSAWAHYFLGSALRFAGRQKEAITMFKEAIRLNPIPPSSFYGSLANAYCLTGQYEEAITAGKKATHLGPNNLFARAFLAAAYSLHGREEEARIEARELMRINPRFLVAHWAKTIPYKNEADKELIITALRKAGLPETPPLPLPDKPSIAVLPFVNMSEDPKQEYFSDGITEEIITALSKTPKLFVIARNSTFTYKGKPTKVQQVGRELGVKYVLEGSVRKAGDKVRVTAQLVDAQTGNHIWAERYDRDLKDVFAIQDEITMKIITALQIKLTEGEQAGIYARGTGNLEAYLKFLEAIEYGRRQNPDDNQKAKRILEQSIALDPNYAAAYRLLGALHMFDVWLGSTNSPKDSLRRAVELSKKAIALDESLGMAHALLGHIYILMKDYERGIEAGQRAVEVEPNDADAHAYLGMGLTFADRPEEAIKAFKRAIRLNPKAPSWYLHQVADAYRHMGRYDEAITWGKKAVDRNPKNLPAHLVLAACYSLAGREKEAQAEAAQVLRISPSYSLERLAKTDPTKNQVAKKRYIDALRKAGLK
jgi:TolB-like protein/Tfp pilus assembly protein PilF